jgi:hypothetical protein
MRPLRKVVIASAGAAALVGVVGMAAANIENTHVLDVRLPDGSVAHIRYIGDTPPRVSVAPPPMSFSILTQASDLFDETSPFAALDRMSRAMDRQAADMIREADAQAAQPITGRDLMPVEIGNPPPGARGFSMVSTMSGGNVCTRSVEYRSRGDGAPPQVVTRTSGACAAAETRPAPSLTSGSMAAVPRPEPVGRQPI